MFSIKWSIMAINFWTSFSLIITNCSNNSATLLSILKMYLRDKKKSIKKCITPHKTITNKTILYRLTLAVLSLIHILM